MTQIWLEENKKKINLFIEKTNTKKNTIVMYYCLSFSLVMYLPYVTLKLQLLHQRCTINSKFGLIVYANIFALWQ